MTPTHRVFFLAVRIHAARAHTFLTLALRAHTLRGHIRPVHIHLAPTPAARTLLEVAAEAEVAASALGEVRALAQGDLVGEVEHVPRPTLPTHPDRCPGPDRTRALPRLGARFYVHVHSRLRGRVPLTPPGRAHIDPVRVR